jgi:hypothetical protein
MEEKLIEEIEKEWILENYRVHIYQIIKDSINLFTIWRE